MTHHPIRRLIRLIESHSLPDGFEKVEATPEDAEDPWHDDSLVSFETPFGSGLLGGVDWPAGECTITHFSATGSRQGNGRRTAQWLRQHFPSHITVHQPGHPGDASLAFWKAMKAEGLVDEVLDDEHFDAEFKSVTGGQGA